MHWAHAAMGLFSLLLNDANGSIIMWTTGWKLHPFVNSTVSPGQFNYSDKINKERKKSHHWTPSHILLSGERMTLPKTEQRGLQCDSGCPSQCWVSHLSSLCLSFPTSELSIKIVHMITDSFWDFKILRWELLETIIDSVSMLRSNNSDFQQSQ